MIQKKYKHNDIDEFLSCEKWTISINDKKDYMFNILYMYNLNDYFYSLVIPQKKIDLLKFMWYKII